MVIVGLHIDKEDFVQEIGNSDLFVYPVYADADLHPVHNQLSFIFVKNIKTLKEYVIGDNHYDCVPETLDVNNTLFIYNKKQLLHTSQHVISTARIENALDAKYFVHYHTNIKLNDIEESDTVSWYTRNSAVTVNHIPVLKLISHINTEFHTFKSTYDVNPIDDMYVKYDMMLCRALGFVESSGVETTHGRLFTNYNVYTKTGRPSNAFGGINFSALKKDGDRRESFISRFDRNGFLVQLDFKAYHPRLLSRLVGYNIDMNIDVYDFLAKQYFNKTEVTADEIADAKGITFLQIYGGVRDEYKHIPFFKAIIEYTEQLWSIFQRDGYITTPIFKRKLHKEFYDNIKPATLLNYLIQAFETERNIILINIIRDYIIKHEKQSKLLLYTYDSLLIDFHKRDGWGFIEHMRTTMCQDYYPMSVYIGYNYKDMMRKNI